MPRRQAAAAPDEAEDQPSPTWSGVITFGLVSVPVSLFPATRGSTLRLRMVSEEGALLRRRYFSETGDAPLASGDVVRGHEVEPDRFVVIEDEELDALAPEKSREIDLQRFVPLADIDPMHFENAYFLVPDGGSTKAYRLLARTMTLEKRAGVATFVMRGTEYLCALIAEAGILRLETLRFLDEVRTPQAIGLPALKPAPPRAVAEMSRAIRALKAAELDRSPLEDRLADRIVRLAEKKLKAGTDVVEADVEEEEEADESSPDVIDLLQVLKDRLAGRSGKRTGAPTPVRGKTPTPERKSSGLASRTKAELYQLAQEMDLPGRSSMSRPELLKAVQAADR
jgi:DNA end-binding protein Ku